MELLKSQLKSFLSTKGKNFIFLRSAENISSLAGTLAGWTDSKLSDYGKKQSNLLYSGVHEFIPQFSSFTSSDLTRAVNTLQYSTLYTVPFNKDERLREIFYGDHEGEHFDSMSEEMRNMVNSMDYQAPNGESWKMVKRRALKFLETKEDGNHFCVSHGGLICTLTYDLGFTDVIPNASIAAFSMNGQKISLEFTWDCPDLLNK